MTKSISIIAGATLLTLGLTACGGDDASEGSNGSEGGGDAASFDLVEDGTLTVCSDIPYPPFEDHDDTAESGYSGFDIELVEAFAEGLDLDIAIRAASFEGLQSGLSLNAGQCDMVASAMTITPDREENIAFSDPYYESLQSLLVESGSDITGIEDLEGKKVAVQQGTTGAAYAEENATGAEIVSFPDDGAIGQAVNAGQVDAVLQDQPVNLNYTEDGSWTIIEEFATDENYGFGFKKDNTALVDAINEQLAAVQEDGTYDELYDKYFAEDGGDDEAATSDS